MVNIKTQKLNKAQNIVRVKKIEFGIWTYER